MDLLRAIWWGGVVGEFAERGFQVGFHFFGGSLAFLWFGVGGEEISQHGAPTADLHPRALGDGELQGGVALVVSLLCVCPCVEVAAALFRVGLVPFGFC
jgi:hypothetical protein